MNDKQFKRHMEKLEEIRSKLVMIGVQLFFVTAVLFFIAIRLVRIYGSVQ